MITLRFLIVGFLLFFALVILGVVIVEAGWPKLAALIWTLSMLSLAAIVGRFVRGD